MQNYTEALEKLGNRRTRKLENNTYLELRDNGAIAVRLHATDVVTYHADGRITLSSGGWRTVTTKDRINNYSPFGISQVRRVWYVYPEHNWSGVKAEFVDGITFRFNLEGNIWRRLDNEMASGLTGRIYSRSNTPTIDREIPLSSISTPNVKEHVARGEEI